MIFASTFANAAASSYGGGPGNQGRGRSDQELELNGGPAPRAEAEEFYEQFVQQATAREDGPEPSLAGATQYAQARLLSVVEGSGRDRLNIGPIDERTDAVVRAAMARSQARDRAAQADINAQLQQLKASIDKSQALANMQAMADAYRASGMVGATGDPQPYLFTVQSATLAAAASQPLTPSMQAVGVAAESALRAAAEIPLAVVDLAQAGVGAAITATTGYVPDLTMYSGMGRSAQEGAGTREMLQNLNPMLGLFIGTDQALYGLLQGDTRPLASLSGSLLGGGLAGRVTPSMPGYRPGVWSPGTVRAGQFAADAMPRLSPSGPMGLRAQMGAAGDLPSALPTVATVGNLGDAGSRRTVISTGGVPEQAQLAASMVPGLTETQAKVLLEGAFNPNKPVEVVLGGSRVRSYFGEGTFRPDSDLDIGFNAKMKNNQIDKILDAFDAQGPLQSERGIRIFSGNNPPSGPILSPQDFFQRSGIRGPFPPERAGEPFGPSGFILFHPNGTITIVPPRGGL